MIVCLAERLMDQGIGSVSLNPDTVVTTLAATDQPQEGLTVAVDREKRAKMKKAGRDPGLLCRASKR